MAIGRAQGARWAGLQGPANALLTEMGVDSRMAEEVLAGLKGIPKTISAKYLYDAEGSRLFERICELPEYYPTRTEASILRRHAGSILDRLGRDLCIIELGAGACRKGRLLLETGRATTFVPVDISTECLWDAAVTIAHSFPCVSVHAVAMDFLASIDSLGSIVAKAEKRILFYAGSSIGNFDPPEARLLLGKFYQLLHEGDALLIGYDLKKDPNLLRRAYNDTEGVTAAFNLNILARLNRELEADFDVGAFRHLALYNERLGRIEMHLVSLTGQEVTVAKERISLVPLERIHTESSYKYTVPEFDGMAEGAGFDRVGIWTDEASYFAVGLYYRGT